MIQGKRAIQLFLIALSRYVEGVGFCVMIELYNFGRTILYLTRDWSSFLCIWCPIPFILFTRSLKKEGSHQKKDTGYSYRG